MTALIDALRARRRSPIRRFMAGEISADRYVRLTRSATRRALAADRRAQARRPQS